MNRNLTSAVLFAAVLAASVIHLRVLENATGEFTSRLDECKQSIFSGNSFDPAPLYESWEEYYSTAAFVTRSEMLGEMAVSVAAIATLPPDDSDDIAEELGALRCRAELILDEQRPHLRSIL